MLAARIPALGVFRPSHGQARSGSDLSGARPSRFANPNIYLRTEIPFDSLYALQNVVIGRVLGSPADRQVIATGGGGFVFVLDQNSGQKLATGPDLGTGGGALSLFDLDGDGVQEILVAPAYEPMLSTGVAATSTLSVLRYSASTSSLQVIAQAPLGELTTDISGKAARRVTAMTGSGAGAPKRIVVTTLGGELIAFEWNAAASSLTRKWSGFVEGGLGAFHSLHLGNLTGASTDELYLASTMGIKKFHF